MAAKKVWFRKKLDAIADKLISDVLERRKHDDNWRDVKFIPLAGTYLNNERWEDEIETFVTMTPKEKQLNPGQQKFAEIMDELRTGRIVQ